MSIIDTINNARNVTNLPAQNTVGGANPAGQMDQNDFLRLMTTQLTTQDPFNPVDNTQMVAQMAQFSQVAGIGAVVHTETMGAQQAGNVAVAWDGKNEAGEYVAGGPLRMIVTATKSGQTFNAATATWTSIGGIQSPATGGESRLVTGLGLLEPSAAIRLA